MTYDVIHAGTRHLLTNYLSPLASGPWTIQGACITARAFPSYGLPADAVATRVLIEEPDQGWTAAIEVIQRGGRLWRLRIERFIDDSDERGPAELQAAYLDWLRSL